MVQDPRLPRSGGRVLMATAALTLWASLSWADSHVSLDGTYFLYQHSISSGGKTLRNGCFVLSSSIGQVAPGYSSDDLYALHAGFLAAMPDRAHQDPLFSDAFEDCTP